MVGAWPAVAALCVQLPLMQLKVDSGALRLVAPDAYTCELSVLIMAAPHEPPDVSVHVVQPGSSSLANKLANKKQKQKHHKKTAIASDTVYTRTTPRHVRRYGQGHGAYV